MGYELNLVLVADPNPQTAASMAATLRACFPCETTTASELADALRQLDQGQINMVFCGTEWGQGDCCVLLERTASNVPPVPLMLMGHGADPCQVAQLVQQGALGYYDLGSGAAGLKRCVDEIPDPHQVCRRAARTLLGQLDLKEAQWRLRAEMSIAALHQVHGSRRAAANLLGVDRRYVQRMFNEFAEMGEWTELAQWADA